jgi:mono/diheme cytochrome c family protein
MRGRRRLAAWLVVFGVIGGTGGWVLSAPQRVDERVLAGLQPGDAGRGERIFNAGGCASCHAGPEAEGEARLRLAGGTRLATDFGTFVAPNISQDKADGIGGWTDADLLNAMLAGVSPEGAHYYPAFPYTSYARMTAQDVVDLHAYLKTLPAVGGRAPSHEVPFPFSIRRGLGLWKRLYLSPEPVVALAPDASAPQVLGRYLAEGPGHCGECHTPRGLLGAADKAQWLAGAAAAEGDGTVPNITGGEGGIGGWSEADIAELLSSGFTPDFDSVGGAMADVVRNTAKLTPQDRAAIAAYLKAVPAHADGYPARPQPAPAG